MQPLIFSFAGFHSKSITKSLEPQPHARVIMNMWRIDFVARTSNGNCTHPSLFLVNAVNNNHFYTFKLPAWYFAENGFLFSSHPMVMGSGDSLYEPTTWTYVHMINKQIHIKLPSVSMKTLNILYNHPIKLSHPSHLWKAVRRCSIATKGDHCAQANAAKQKPLGQISIKAKRQQQK